MLANRVNGPKVRGVGFLLGWKGVQASLVKSFPN